MKSRLNHRQGTGLALTCFPIGILLFSVLEPSGANADEPRLISDPGLTAVAAAHATQILQNETQANLDTVMALLVEHGIADAQVLPFAVVGASLSELEIALKTFEQEEALPRAYTHLGLADRKRGQQHALVGLFSRRLIDIPKLTKRLSRKQLRVAVSPTTVTRLDDKNISAYLSNPSGQVTKFKLHRNWKTGEAQFYLRFLDGPGRYVFETLIDGPRGPEVSALWRFDLGNKLSKSRIPPEKMKLPDTRQTVFALMRRARVGLKLKALRSSASLSKAASAHAKKVCGQRIAAHILPGGVPPSIRARRHGYNGLVAENIAIAQTVARAHENLLESPSHRANIIDPSFTEIGLGLAFRRSGAQSSRFDKRPARTWCLVQLFGKAR